MESEGGEESDLKKAKVESDASLPAPSVTISRMSFLVGGGAYVWDPADILTLRQNRLGGELVGADFTLPSQNLSHGPPLALCSEEVPLACRLLSLSFPPSHAVDTLRARVFAELHRRGYWLAKGTSFGCDYLVYAGEPNVYHASFLLLVKPWSEAASMLSFITAARLGTTVKKTAVIASQKDDGEFWFYTMKWLGT